MKCNYCILLSILALGFMACENGGTPFDITSIDQNTLALINNIEANKDTMEERGPIMVTRDGEEVAVTGYFHGDDAMLIHIRHSDRDAWNYMQGLNVVLLKEFAPTKNGGAIIERQFYYNDSNLLGQRMRKAASLEELPDSPFQSLSIKSKDGRYDPVYVTSSAVGYMYGY